MGRVERTVHTNGLDLQLLGWNLDAAGCPLLILHGFLEQALAWEEVAVALDRPVWALDHRGHGTSDHVGPGGFYHFWDYVSDVDAVLDALSPDAPLHLLGHSMGGSIACLYAGSRPDRVNHLILVEGLGPPDSTDSLVDRARIFLRHRREGTPHGPPFANVEAAAARMMRFNSSLSPDAALQLAERQTYPVDDGVQWAWDPRHRARSPRPFDVQHFIPFLAAITSPTLVITGERSSYPGTERAHYLADVRCLDLPAGHLVHHDVPQLLVDAIQQHLESEGSGR